jgi:hypothetical protein
LESSDGESIGVTDVLKCALRSTETERVPTKKDSHKDSHFDVMA